MCPQKPPVLGTRSLRGFPENNFPQLPSSVAYYFFSLNLSAQLRYMRTSQTRCKLIWLFWSRACHGEEL